MQIPPIIERNVYVTQVQNYMNYLSNAFLIHRVERYDIVGKRLFEFGEKYYFENLGIRNVVVGYRISDRAKLMENVVFNHLKYRGYSVKIGTIGNQEVDFVAEKDNEHIFRSLYELIVTKLPDEN